MELLQIATAQFITKCDRLLLQIATAFLLQSATRFITNCDRYYKVRWLLQIATVHGLTPLEKCQFFELLKFFFYSVQRRFFVLKYHKRLFPSLNCLKKKFGKMAIFGQKPWVYSVERRFFVLKYCKPHSPAINCLKKTVGKTPIFGPNPWVNPFGKMSILRLFELLVFIA